jgi:pimeloyl-ACP methyl ester carboxylesterase
MTALLNGWTVDYVERGTGPCIVLVPGSFSTTAAWKPVSELLNDRFRVVAISLMGYGRSEEQRTADRLVVDAQAEAVEAAIAQAGAQVHLVGHSWGGSVALSVALRGHAELASLTLIEANPVDVLRQNGDHELYEDVQRMSEAYIAAYNAGEHDAARRVVEFWEGQGSFDRLPPKVREYAIQTTPVNIRDWSACYAFHPTAGDGATLALPTLVMCGGRSHPAARRMAQILTGWIPRARAAEVSPAAHFLISTHPREVAELIATHVVAAENSRS